MVNERLRVKGVKVELDSHEAFDEIEHSLLLHEGTSPFLGIVRPIHARNVGNMEPHSTRERTRVVHDGRPVPATFVVSLESGRSSVGNYDCGVRLVRVFPGRRDETYVQPKTIPRTVSKVLWMERSLILSWWMTVMVVLQAVNINIQCQHRKKKVASIAFTEGRMKSAILSLPLPRGISQYGSQERAIEGNEPREACNSLTYCRSVRGFVPSQSRTFEIGGIKIVNRQ